MCCSCRQVLADCAFLAFLEPLQLLSLFIVLQGQSCNVLPLHRMWRLLTQNLTKAQLHTYQQPLRKVVVDFKFAGIDCGLTAVKQLPCLALHSCHRF